MGTHMPYGITQCYLAPGIGDIPPFTPAKLVLNLATPEGCKAELTLVNYMFTHSFCKVDIFSCIVSLKYTVSQLKSGQNSNKLKYNITQQKRMLF